MRFDIADSRPAHIAEWLANGAQRLAHLCRPHHNLMKQLLMAHAMGDLGDLPQVARLQAAPNVLS